MQKSKKIALIILGSLAGLLLIYTLAGFLGVPYALKNTLPAKLKDINASLSVAEAYLRAKRYAPRAKYDRAAF